MHIHGKTKLGFFPLPINEAGHLRQLLQADSSFSAVDPCVGDGVAFDTLLRGLPANRYGIEIDAYRSNEARRLEIDVLQADALNVRCPVESLSLLYLNPPYDWESGHSGNRRLEHVFLEHTYRWLVPEGILIFVIPQSRIEPCARILANHFKNIRVFRLTDPESVRFKQIAIVAARRKRSERPEDAVLLEAQRYLESMAVHGELCSLESAGGPLYWVPPSGPATLSNTGLPLDEIEDILLRSSAYRQCRRVLLHDQSNVRGRPLTPLHGGHVGLLCTAGLLNGVFGQGEQRHIACWRSVKFVDHWEEQDGEATIVHDRERFSHELTLVFSNGQTLILNHEKASKT